MKNIKAQYNEITTEYAACVGLSVADVREVFPFDYATANAVLRELQQELDERGNI